MEENNTILTAIDNGIGLISMNRPAEMNAVNLEMLNEIAYQIQNWEYDDNIRCIILTGNEHSFAAGIDVKDLAQEVGMQSLAMKAWQDEFSKIANCSKPLIAAVSGYALGVGCDLA